MDSGANGRAPFSPAGEPEFLAAARRIGEDLLATARELPDGSLTWGRGAGRDQQPVADSGPFNGRCGEALLLAALAAATGEETWARACSQVLLTLRRGLPDAGYRERLATEVTLGLSGLAGILYCLVRIAGLLDRPELIDDARRVAALLTPERIEGDYQYDVIWGNAGVLLALLALDAAGDEEAVAGAELCGRHLLAHRKPDPVSGLRAWPTLRAVPSSGFAHGASGIAHALLALHRRTADDAFYDAALEAFAFERTLLHEDPPRRWEDSRVEPAGVPRMWSWCHGAPGIALARLGSVDLLREGDEGPVVADLREALQQSIHARVPGVDTICCGYFGRIEVLIEAGRVLGNESLALNARQLARQRLGRAAAKDGFLLNDIEPTVEAHLWPGLWQGLGGSAYSLLRLTDPERFPCILTMA
ncbi:MAG TPA: lanthionine synthetase LanC family protein [Thermoanaerobaculia bacterium]|nr:lanthionine synthetase LanC family protein [Thermoanaerobaculia bacterium]